VYRRGIELQWFKSYLEDRYQRHLFNGSCSEEAGINLGVPQGSAIGALLFILYINDLLTVTEYCCVNLFADDTLIYISGTNLNDIIDRLNSDLNVVSDWLKVNRLKLNVDKTKFQIVSRSPASQLVNVRSMIDHQQLEREAVVKYLGIQIDEKLILPKTSASSSRKWPRKLIFLVVSGKKLTLNSRKLVYIKPSFHHTLIIVHLSYIWHQKNN
jgi:hypothetical protein